MEQTIQAIHERGLWTIALASALRAAFGIMWAINAFITWTPGFAERYGGYLQNASQGQPTWLLPWFQLWNALIQPAPGFFVWVTRIVETLIAIGLLLGLLRKPVYILGLVFSLLIWSTAEGFSGPYAVGASNLGPALLYVIIFVALIGFARLLGRTPYSLDYYIERRSPGWYRIAEFGPSQLLNAIPPRLPWSVQGGAIAAILVAVILLFGSLQSAMGAAPATPSNAAAAVSPLNLAVNGPIPNVRDATLPPLAGTGDSVDITIESTDATVQIANGVNFQAWTFGGMVPGPILHVRQGQKVNLTYINNGKMQHSLDLHAAEIAPSAVYKNINPGETLKYSFTPSTPGAFVYHCGTAPVLLHMANGMYGAIIVDPIKPLPPADVSYVLVQSEWYTQQVNQTLLTGDFNKMKAGTPDEVVFNGVAFQYKDHPLPAKAGQRIRLYVVDAGPSLPSAFHVIGGIFSDVYTDGDVSHALKGVSTWEVAPGQGVIFDITLSQPGQYPFVDHSMRNMFIGAVGVLDIQP